MAHFVRRGAAPLVTRRSYTAFRPFVREDFDETCAYCLLPEVWAGGEQNFELDHFRPRARFDEGLNDFYNLFYACHPCNHIKLDKWPSSELEARGFGYANLCDDDFATHFVVEPNGCWQGRTNPAIYSIAALKLNRRHLCEIRVRLARLRVALPGVPPPPPAP